MPEICERKHMFEFAAIKSVVVDSSMTQSAGGGGGLGLVSVYLGLAWGLCGVGSGFVHDLLRVSQGWF